jgi:hypothetical protein
MSALVVYESMFGSTKAIAEAIAEGIGESGVVEVVEVGAFAAGADGGAVPADVTLLVVGGPTHAFSLSRESTREDAAKEAPAGVISTGKGLREWLEDVKVADGLRFAAFDTKVLKPNLPGSAAKAADKRLRQHSARPVTKPHSFKVHGKSDGLVDGELEAAREWGRSLGAPALVG